MTEMGEFGPGQDWDARAHVRLLRTNGGASSGYTADLIERLYTELIAAAFASQQQEHVSVSAKTEHVEGDVLSRTSQGGEWVDRCPACGCRFKADIEKSDGSPDGRVRCVECKAVFGQALTASPSPYAAEVRPAGHFHIAHDDFAGDVIGHYTTREGKPGVVLQQDGTRVVHVYGEKWLKPAEADGNKPS